MCCEHAVLLQHWLLFTDNVCALYDALVQHIIHATNDFDLASVQVSLASCALYNALVQQIFPLNTCFGPGISSGFTGSLCTVQRSGAADFPT